jgi:glutamyl/glutaminyl-tRNA synthetase
MSGGLTRARIAPSPTGPLHIGTARTALFNYLFARHTGGTFILRLEDTDQARGSIAYEKDILDGLHWLGLGWDEGPRWPVERTSGRTGRIARCSGSAATWPQPRTPRSRPRLSLLLHARGARGRPKAQEAAHEAPRYVGRVRESHAEERSAREAAGRRGAIRFRVPAGKIGWDDLVRGDVEIDTANIGGDFVIVRSDGTPLYHFAVVVDDAEMEISQIIRARTTSRTRPSTSSCSGRSATPSRSSPTCRSSSTRTGRR